MGSTTHSDSQIIKKETEEIEYENLFDSYIIYFRPCFSDWCISRQLWWGHRIPAFECSVGDQKVWVGAKSSDEARAKASTQLKVDGEGILVRQDEDVLDTWFSSSLLPFSAFGWPKQVIINFLNENTSAQSVINKKINQLA